MTETALIELLRKTVADVLQRQLPELTTESLFADLGIDSIGLIEVMGELEDNLRLTFADADIARLRTIGDLGTLIERASSERDTRERTA